MVNPVPGGRIGTPYGRRCCTEGRPHYWSGHAHRGVDIVASKGTPVYAPWSGKIIGIGIWGSAFGSRSPVIDFDKLPDGSPGLWGILAHLDTVNVKVGQRVSAGQRIGTVGARGNVTGPHLHFEIQTSNRWRPASAGNVTRNPQKWIDASVKSEDSMALWRDYSGKPSGKLLVKRGGFTKLDAVTKTPTKTGHEEHMVYLNCKPVWDGPTGTIRVRYVRSDGDATAYQDYVLTKDSIDPGDSFLITHVHFEIGKAGVGGRWEIKCTDGIKEVSIGTRYAKVHVIY